MDVGSLKYPKKSHRKPITLPHESQLLAEFMGIVFGDGGINNNWQLVITLNSISDLLYSEYASSLGKKIFNIEAAIHKRKTRNTLIVVFSSTSLVDFLVSKGAVRGNKIQQQINMPK